MCDILDMMDAELGRNCKGFCCLFYGKGSRLLPLMDKAHLQAREDYFELHEYHPHLSYSLKLMLHVSSDIYTDCLETKSLKLKADLDAGALFIFAGMEESTELFYFQKTDFEPLQHYFTTSKEQRVSPLLAYLVVLLCPGKMIQIQHIYTCLYEIS